MTITRDDFEEWIFDMSDKLESFLANLPEELFGKLDYSPESLTTLEKWLLEQYPNVKSIRQHSERLKLDAWACYVGETFRKNLGGIWDIDLTDKKNAYYSIPVLKKNNEWVECPHTLLTASMDRRSGRYIHGVFSALATHYGWKNEKVK